jgi:hypothetical protein
VAIAALAVADVCVLPRTHQVCRTGVGMHRVEPRALRRTYWTANAQPAMLRQVSGVGRVLHRWHRALATRSAVPMDRCLHRTVTRSNTVLELLGVRGPTRMPLHLFHAPIPSHHIRALQPAVPNAGCSRTFCDNVHAMRARPVRSMEAALNATFDQLRDQTGAVLWPQESLR